MKKSTLALVCAIAISIVGCGRGPGLVVVPEIPTQISGDLQPLWSMQMGPIQLVQSQQAWSRDLQPVALDGQRLMLAHGQEILLLDLDNPRRPEQLWRMEVETGSLAAGASIADDVFAYTTDKGALELRQLDDQQLLWRQQLSARANAKVAINGRYVISYNQDGLVQSFRQSDGQLVWQYQTRVPDVTLLGTARPVIAADQVIIATPGGRVMSLDLITGQVNWEYRIAVASGRTGFDRLVDADANPVVMGDSVFVSALNGQLVQIDLNTGRVRGSVNLDTLVSPLILEDRLIVISPEGNIQGLSPTGEPIWSIDDWRLRRYTAPQLWGDYILVADAFGAMLLLDPEDGRVHHAQQVHGIGYVQPPLVVGQDAFFQSASGRITALRLR